MTVGNTYFLLVPSALVTVSFLVLHAGCWWPLKGRPQKVECGLWASHPEMQARLSFVAMIDIKRTLQRGWLAFLASLLVCSAGFAQNAGEKPVPDLLIFKNGDQLTGKLESGTGTTIVFKSDMAGELTVSLDNVKELRTHGRFALLQKGIPLKPSIIGTIVHPGTLAVADGTVSVTTPDGTTSSVAGKNVAFLLAEPAFREELSRQSLLRGWKGSLNAGATDVQATSYGTTFTLGLNLVRAMPEISFLSPHDRTTFDLVETFGKLTQPVVPQTSPATPDSIAKTSIFHADLEHDRYLSARFYTLGDLGIDHNFSQGLDLQQVYGGGFGWTVLQRPDQQLELKVDTHYEKQNFNSTVATGTGNIVGSQQEWAIPSRTEATAHGMVRTCTTGSGSSLSAFASSKLTCHICVSERTWLYAGMPVSRIPLSTFQ